MARKGKLGIKARLFWSVAGAALLVWLVTMGVLTALTYQRIVEDAEVKINLVRSEVNGELGMLMNGDQNMLRNYLAEESLQEQFINILTRAAWPKGQFFGGGYSYSENGEPLFYGAARITYKNLESRSGNYLRLYSGENDQFYYLPLDGVFSTEDVERMMTAHQGFSGIESWTGGEAKGYFDKGLFWADELIFYHENGTEDRYTAAEPQSGEDQRHIAFDERADLGGSQFYRLAKSQEAQELLASGIMALDKTPTAAADGSSDMRRTDSLWQKELWYPISCVVNNMGGNSVSGLGYATYFPLHMAFLELWRTYLFTFMAALALTLFFSARAAKRFGVPVASLHYAAQSNGNTDNYRVESGIRELDDLGESLARLTKAEKEAKWKIQEDLKREQSLTRAVAHELKTPLAILRSHAEALSEDIAPTKREQYLGIIMDESDRMAALVGELLDLSRMEAGAEVLNREEVDLKTLTERVFAPLQNLTRVSLILESLTLSGDPKLLERAISNYASNALRHCAEGGEIRVSLRAEGGSAVLTVENDGEPIPTEALPRLWDTFYKADTARTRTGGTGLGLAIVRSIATLHGGSCGAENRKEGPVFRLSLPCNSPPLVVL